jgi:hypothetical protein
MSFSLTPDFAPYSSFWCCGKWVLCWGRVEPCLHSSLHLWLWLSHLISLSLNFLATRNNISDLCLPKISDPMHYKGCAEISFLTCLWLQKTDLLYLLQSPQPRLVHILDINTFILLTHPSKYDFHHNFMLESCTHQSRRISLVKILLTQLWLLEYSLEIKFEGSDKCYCYGLNMKCLLRFMCWIFTPDVFVGGSFWKH